jgi:hypothetical protein
MKTNQKGLSAVNGLLILIVVAVVSTVGWYVWQRRSDQKTSDRQITAPSGFKAFQNHKYNIGFIYPDTWPTPVINEVTDNNGKLYNIVFPIEKRATDAHQVLITLTMENKDVTKKTCDKDGKCSTSPALTADTIKSAAAQSDASYVRKDESSYATLTTPPERISNGLTVYQITDLKNLNISAAKGTYFILGPSANCPNDKFTNSTGCVNEQNYEQLLKVLRSIQPLSV